MTDLTGTLKKIFGFGVFRPNQQEIVEAVLAGRDSFAVMPTGGGKSLCYQLPAYLQHGTCLVISPLISLMKDQVDGCLGLGLRAAFLNSTLTGPEMTSVYRRLREGALDLLYVAPERFAMDDFLARLETNAPSFIAIDE
ncbi:MAG: DEAD/DEAH box helicase, partial [Deltaproteobacteria bacterium]|nr:DEAD/DEAH box helicase [Deltaproteobacteria bacterium]